MMPGQVVGQSDLIVNPQPAHPFHPFLWQKDTGMIDLGTLGGPGTQADEATAINNLGQVVGGADTGLVGQIPNRPCFPLEPERRHAGYSQVWRE